MKNWRVEQTAGGKRLAEVKIQRGISQAYALSPSLFVIAMMSLNYTIRKRTGGYKLSRHHKKAEAKEKKNEKKNTSETKL